MNHSGTLLLAASHEHAAQFAFDAMDGKGAPTIRVPDTHLLFSGEYQRLGSDLIISDHVHRVVVPDYFRSDSHARPLSVSPDGAPLASNVVDALTGHTAYAQADPQSAAGKVVGHVVKMTGS